MRFKEGLYYFLITITLLSILYLFLLKTELLDRWITGGLVTVVLLIFRQLYKLVEKNGD